MNFKYYFFLWFTLIFFGCDGSHQTNPDQIKLPGEKTAEVEGVIATTRQFSNDVITNGRLAAKNKVDVPFIGSELLQTLNIRNGQHVKKGQVLAILDNFAIKNKLEQSRIFVEKTKISFYDMLIGQGYDHRKLDRIPKDITEVARIKSEYASAENEYKLIQHQYEATFILAPISGTIANLKIKQNNYAHSGELLCTIIDSEHFEVIFPVLESEVGSLQDRSSVLVYPYFDDGREVSGVITEINPIVEKNGLVLVTALLNNDTDHLYEGMNIKVIIKKRSRKELSVPKSAIVLRSGKPVIFTCVGGVANWNYVTLGDQNNSNTAIKQGIVNGDTVIVSGNLNLAHGVKIKLKLR